MHSEILSSSAPETDRVKSLAQWQPGRAGARIADLIISNAVFLREKIFQ